MNKSNTNNRKIKKKFSNLFNNDNTYKLDSRKKHGLEFNVNDNIKAKFNKRASKLNNLPTF